MKHIKGIILLALSLMLSVQGFSQRNVISNNKSLAFLNPALQNAEFKQFYINASILPNPLSDQSNYSSYLFHAEAKLGKQFRVGFHNSTVDTRLHKFDMNKLYASFNFEFEEGNFFALGLEVGRYTDQVKSAEFNKVFAPTQYSFSDSIASDMDFGFGMVYKSRGLTLALSLNKLNAPTSVPFPVQRWSFGSGADSSSIVKKDTSINWGESDFIGFEVQSNINILYEWEASDKVKILHSLHVANAGIDGYDYLGLQNFANFNEKLMVGLGVYHNGNTSFMASLGYNLLPNIRIEGAAFFHEEFNYNPDADYPFAYSGNNPIIAKGAYESEGFIPSFEGNLQLRF